MDDITLKGTVELMLSDDYKERFKAEYFQLKLRHEKLEDVVANYEDVDTLGFEPSCPYYILWKQLEAMGEYLEILEARAQIEGIDLTWQG